MLIFVAYGRGDSGDWYEQKMGQQYEDLLYRWRDDLSFYRGSRDVGKGQPNIKESAKKSAFRGGRDHNAQFRAL